MANDLSPAYNSMTFAGEAGPDGAHNFRSAMQSTARAAAGWLIDRQKPDGHWVGRAESNACMEAQWCLALWFLGLEDHPLAPAPRQRAAANAAPGRRLADLSRRAEWRHQHDRRSLCGAALAGPPRRRAGAGAAREWIASKGGLRNIRVFTRYWLALLGEWPWEKTPNLPPEVDLVSALVPVLDL